jgi:RHS repeat-associated protein
LQWFYDEAGNLVREHQHYLAEKLTAVWRHGYDELNHRIQTTRPDGHKLEWLTYGSGHVHGLVLDGLDVVGFERDALHREVHRTQLNGLAQSQRYDKLGRLLEQQITPNQFSAPVQMGEGAFKYQTSHIATGPATILRQYQYDKSGQIAHIEDNRRGRIEYRYDPVGRLLQATSAVAHETFAFDPAGNIVPAGEAANARDPRALPKVLDNLLKEYAGTHYHYDERGNLIERTQQGRKTTFEWDGFNRMARAIGSDTTTQFAYDPLGRRIAKRHQSGANAQSQTLFGWDGDTLAFESQQVGGKEPRAQTVHYVHEAGSFVPLLQAVQPGLVRLMPTPDVQALVAASGDGYHAELDPLWNGELDEEEATPFSTEQVAFYQCDQIGTPQELTDAQGAVAWAAQYKAWGEAKELITEVARKAGFRNPIRFQGQYLDEETGLHYNRHRYYEPVSGRFVSKDPIGLLGGVNVSAYAPNPVSWADPLGLSPKKPTSGGSGKACPRWSWQGTKPYDGVDSYTNTVLKKGTVLYTLHPYGPKPGNYFAGSAAVLQGATARGYNDTVQVSHAENTPGARPMRREVQAFVLKEDLCVAKGQALANPHLGDGGGTQYFIDSADKSKLVGGPVIKFSK